MPLTFAGFCGPESEAMKDEVIPLLEGSTRGGECKARLMDSLEL